LDTINRLKKHVLKIKLRVSKFLDRRLGKRATSLIVVTLSFFVLAYALLRNWNDVRRYEWRLYYPSLLLSFAAYCLALFLAISAWSLLLRRMGEHSSFKTDAKIYCSTNLARRMPAIGDVSLVTSRIYLYEKAGIGNAAIALVLLWEVVLQFVSAAVISVASLPFTINPLLADHWQLLLFVLPLIVVVVRPGILNTVINFVLTKSGHKRTEAILTHRDTLTAASLYMGVWIGGGITLYLFANAVHPIPLTYVSSIIGIWALTGLISRATLFVPGSLGLREATLSLLLSPYIPLPRAVIISVLFRLWMIVCETIWAMVTLKL